MRSTIWRRTNIIFAAGLGQLVVFRFLGGWVCVYFFVDDSLHLKVALEPWLLPGVLEEGLGARQRGLGFAVGARELFEQAWGADDVFGFVDAEGDARFHLCDLHDCGGKRLLELHARLGRENDHLNQRGHAAANQHGDGALVEVLLRRSCIYGRQYRSIGGIG